LRQAINIPLGELENRVAEIPAAAMTVFLCRSGARSLRACGIAVRAGMHEPAHLEGGLLAWAADIDPSLEVVAAG